MYCIGDDLKVGEIMTLKKNIDYPLLETRHIII